MSTKFPSYSSFILIQLALLSTTQSRIILDRQCWHENPFRTVNIDSSSVVLIEYVSLIHSPRQQLSSFIKEKEEISPWTYPPECTDILQGIDDKLCVYTSTSFSHGRGISVFTTPTLAAQLASLPAFHDPSALDAREINTDSGTWITESIPGKGFGMLASKPLTFGDRVTAYTPAFLAYFETEMSTLDRERWWRLAIVQLPEVTKNEFMGLAWVIGDERVRAQDIVKANTFQLEVAGVNHLVVYPETSRLNHACAPNAQYVIDPELLSHTVHVTRPIAKGEEITISYTSPLEPISTRQRQLSTGFHFTCTCPRCTSPATDTTLSTILSLQSQLNDWSATSTGSPELAEQLLQLHRDEGLEGFMDVAYGFAALAWNAVGESEKAVGYARKAKQAILMKDGRWAPNLRIWEEVLGDVKGHWSYKQRV